jgi:hypothetical protein
MNTKELLKVAMIRKYEAEISDAEARLSVYFNSPVGIGEHPQITEEIDGLIEKLSNAKGKLSDFNKVYKKIS